MPRQPWPLAATEGLGVPSLGRTVCLLPTFPAKSPEVPGLAGVPCSFWSPTANVAQTPLENMGLEWGRAQKEQTSPVTRGVNRS